MRPTTRQRLDDLERRVALLEQPRRGMLAPNAIRRARMLAGWSKAHLAGLVGVGHVTVCRWETGVRACKGDMAEAVVAAFVAAGVAAPEME